MFKLLVSIVLEVICPPNAAPPWLHERTDSLKTFPWRFCVDGLKVIDHIGILFSVVPSSLFFTVCVQSIYSGWDVVFILFCQKFPFSFEKDGPFQRSLKAKSCYCFLVLVFFPDQIFPPSYFSFFPDFLCRLTVRSSGVWQFSFATFIYKCSTGDLVLFPIDPFPLFRALIHRLLFFFFSNIRLKE